jgi:hypothetical protein
VVQFNFVSCISVAKEEEEEGWVILLNECSIDLLASQDGKCINFQELNERSHIENLQP